MSEPAVRSLSPLGDESRIDVLDILRGFALVGIVFMNVEFFNRSSLELATFDRSLTGMDHAAGWLVRVFIEGKFYKLFAFMFGLGFTVMMLRAREAGRPWRMLMTRRLGILFVIGTLHSILLWGGDILTSYAFAGFVLLGYLALFEKTPLRRFNRPGVHRNVGLTWLTLPFMIGSLFALYFGASMNSDEFQAEWDREIEIATEFYARLEAPAPNEDLSDAEESEQDPGETPYDELSEDEKLERDIRDRVDDRRLRLADIEKEGQIMSSGTYAEAVGYWADRFVDQKIPGIIGSALGMFVPLLLIGYWLIHSGMLARHRENGLFFKTLMYVGLIPGYWLNVAGLLLLLNPASDISMKVWIVGTVLFNLGQFLLAAGFFGLIVVLSGTQWVGRGLKVLAPFGRMALTNYLMQTVIFVLIFHGYAGGLWGQIGRADQMLLALVIVAGQVVFSMVWLKFFRFGPMEWLWRAGTYRALPPLRRKTL